MKVLILALWFHGCPGTPPSYAIPMPSLPACEQAGPVVTDELRRLGLDPVTFGCLFQEEPPLGIEACFP